MAQPKRKTGVVKPRPEKAHPLQLTFDFKGAEKAKALEARIHDAARAHQKLVLRGQSAYFGTALEPGPPKPGKKWYGSVLKNTEKELRVIPLVSIEYTSRGGGGEPPHFTITYDALYKTSDPKEWEAVGGALKLALKSMIAEMEEHGVHASLFAQLPISEPSSKNPVRAAFQQNGFKIDHVAPIQKGELAWVKAARWVNGNGKKGHAKNGGKKKKGR